MSGSVTFHRMALAPIIAGLKNAHAFLSKAEQHIKDQGHDANDYLTASLYPDMYDLIKQIQRFTDSAKAIAPRANPVNEVMTLEDTETTFPQLLDRINRTIKYMESIDPKTFEGREDEMMVMKFRGGAVQVEYTVATYIMQFAHPNFWFHVVTAYDILRMKGVPFSKFDYLNGANLVEVKVVEQKEE